MAPSNYNPFRKCSFCGTNNYPSGNRAPERRAWTLHIACNKLSCPGCRRKGVAMEQLAIRENLRTQRIREEFLAMLAEDEGDDGTRITRPSAQMNADLRDAERTAGSMAAEPPAAYGVGVPGQYRRIKASHPDAVLLFHIGAWYVAMNEDADTVSRELGTTMHRFPPLSTRSTEFADTALEQYLPKLVRAGYRVAICDRIEQANGQRQLQVDEHGRSLYGNEHEVPQVAEPPASYRAKKEARYLKNEREKVVGHLEDVIGVFKRHKAMPDHSGLSEWQHREEDDRAYRTLLANIDAIRLELGLRRVWIDKRGNLIMPLGECWTRLQPMYLPQLLATARLHFSGKSFARLPKLGTAPAWAIGNFSTEQESERTLRYAQANAQVAATCADPAVRSHWAKHLADVERLCANPHNYNKVRRVPTWMADTDGLQQAA